MLVGKILRMEDGKLRCCALWSWFWRTLEIAEKFHVGDKWRHLKGFPLDRSAHFGYISHDTDFAASVAQITSYIENFYCQFLYCLS